MKVEEAKEKICPFIQQVYVGRQNTQMFGKTANINCICGDCMAWEYDWMLDGSGNEPCENKKEGRCKRIEQ